MGLRLPGVLGVQVLRPARRRPVGPAPVAGNPARLQGAAGARDRTPEEMARHLADREVYVWSGNMYALVLTERLGLEERGGVLRLGLVHYNTADEVDRVLRALDEL